MLRLSSPFGIAMTVAALVTLFAWHIGQLTPDTAKAILIPCAVMAFIHLPNGRRRTHR